MRFTSVKLLVIWKKAAAAPTQAALNYWYKLRVYHLLFSTEFKTKNVKSSSLSITLSGNSRLNIRVTQS